MSKLLSKIKGVFFDKENASFSLILTISMPLIITNSAQSLLQFTDRMFLAWYSPEALAACVPSGLLSFTIIAFFMGACGYTSIFVANYFGQKKYAHLSVSLWQGVFLGLISWLVIILLIPLGRFFISSTNHDIAIKSQELTYFTILSLFGGLAVINTAFASFFIGQGKTAVTMIANIGGNIVNIALSYIMIFGKLGLPAMGISGAGYSTIISEFCISFFFIWLLFTKENNKKYHLQRLFGFNKDATIKLLRFGVPNGFGMLMDVVSFAIFVLFTGNIDSISLAGSNMIMTLQTLEFLPLMGVTMAGSILVAQYMGLGKQNIATKVIHNVLRLSLTYAIILCFCFMAFPEQILGVFMKGQTSLQMDEIYTKALGLIPYLCIFTFGDVIYLTFGDGLRGAGDTKFQMIIMVCCATLLMIGSFVIVQVFHGSIENLWTYMCIYGVFTGLMMMLRFLFGPWRKIDITK